MNVSSVNGLRSFAGVLAYNISKSALDQFTRCVALELVGYDYCKYQLNQKNLNLHQYETAN